MRPRRSRSQALQGKGGEVALTSDQRLVASFAKADTAPGEMLNKSMVTPVWTVTLRAESALQPSLASTMAYTAAGPLTRCQGRDATLSLFRALSSALWRTASGGAPVQTAVAHARTTSL